MILGYVLLALALVLTMTAGVLFTQSRRKGREALLHVARRVVLGAAAAVVAASAYLVYLIATHQFQVAYVAEYSAKRSDDKYLFAAFWGGQEGSILLWCFWTAVIGTVLAFRGAGREAKVWPIFGAIQSFLLVFVLLKCPFALGKGPVPSDGRGLNPLLENPWMVIHPPVLFLGFASLAVPFSWALYGLIHRDWDGWVRRAFGWTLFSFAVHGFGIALGGYWAYETLGWGGFWAWDPVENSSLVPWLFLTALLHGIAIQRANGGFKVTNFALGFLPFAWMVYGTFLTRTGLLSDFSVHSFSAMGKDGYWLLLAGVLTTFLLPAMLLILRAREIPKPPAYERMATREFGFFLAAALLGLMGVITALGMSAPILTKLWMPKGAAAQPEFYNKATFPLAILMIVGMAATPYFAWRATDTNDVLRRLFPAYAVSIVLTLGMFLLGARKPWMLLLFAAGVFAAGTNVMLLLPRLKRRESRRTVGGFLAHAGAALALVGIACLVTFSQQERVSLTKGQPQRVESLGYTMTYLGMTSHPFNRDNAILVRLQKGGRSWDVRSSFYLAPWGGKDTLFANPPAILPSIYNVNSPAEVSELLPWNNPFPLGDLYISWFRGPLSTDKQSTNAGMEMWVRDTRTFGDYTFAFKKLEFDEATQAAMKEGGMDAVQKLPQTVVHAVLDVHYKGQHQEIKPGLIFSREGRFAVPAVLPGTTNAIMTLDEPKFPGGAVLSTMNVPDAGEVIMLDVSTKPMIGLVWFGTLLYTFGGLIAYRRRAAELSAAEEEPEAPAAPEKQPQAYKRRGKAPGRPAPQPARAAATPPRR